MYRSDILSNRRFGCIGYVITQLLVNISQLLQDSNITSQTKKTTSCIVINLCFNTSSKELLYYSKDFEDIPDYIAIGVFNYVSYSVECFERD